MSHNPNAITIAARDRLVVLLRRIRHQRGGNLTRDARSRDGRRRVRWGQVGVAILVLAVLAIWLILIPR